MANQDDSVIYSYLAVIHIGLFILVMSDPDATLIPAVFVTVFLGWLVALVLAPAALLVFTILGIVWGWLQAMQQALHRPDPKAL